jgi:RimJ/RimL family protein N-acetyltransferase
MGWIEPVILTGRTIRLEPLLPKHAAGLFAVADEALFRFTPQAPPEWSIAGFETELQSVNALPDVVALAVISRSNEAVIGRTTFMDIKPAHRGVEIGRTWIGRAFHGTQVNLEMKFLMMQHVFEILKPPAIRVQFTTSSLNLHSRQAIKKLGAVCEGTLRRDRILADGTFRDTVVYSVIAKEWPVVKNALEQRIGGGNS